MRGSLSRLAGWLVRGVELLCALCLLFSAWILGDLAARPESEQGEGTIGVAVLLFGATVTAVLVAVVVGHAAVRLARASPGDRFAAAGRGLARAAAETAVAAVAVVVWPPADLPLDFDALAAVTVLAVAVVVHVAVDVAQFVRSLAG